MLTQKHATKPYPEPVQLNLHHQNLFKIYFNTVLPSSSQFPKRHEDHPPKLCVRFLFPPSDIGKGGSKHWPPRSPVLTPLHMYVRRLRKTKTAKNVKMDVELR